MSKKPASRIGDIGTHGGTIISGESTILVDGKPIARVGDDYRCPIHGINPIVSGEPSILVGNQLIAHVGSKTACGAEILTGSTTTFVGEYTVSSNQPLLVLSKELGNQYFIIVDDSDKPIGGVEYVLTDVDGTEYHGVTTSDGHTNTIYGKIGELLSIKIKGIATSI